MNAFALVERDFPFGDFSDLGEAESAPFTRAALRREEAVRLRGFPIPHCRSQHWSKHFARHRVHREHPKASPLLQPHHR